MPARHRVPRRTRARIAGIIASLAAMLVLPGPDGEQAGQLSIVYDMDQCIAYAARAYEAGVRGFGDSTVCIAAAQLANPPPGVAANYSRRVLGMADGAGVPFESFYAGKTSVYALDPYDPRQWNPLSHVRFHKHRAAAAGHKLCFVVATYAVEGDALAAERHLVAELGAATGLAALNSVPYHHGRLQNGGADGYIVYVQAR